MMAGSEHVNGASMYEVLHKWLQEPEPVVLPKLFGTRWLVLGTLVRRM